MPKVVNYTSKKWKGSVTLADPMTMPQVRLVDEALEKTSRTELMKVSKTEGEEPTVKTYIVDERMLPAICACVQEWHINDMPETVTPENFPATPRAESHAFIAWLFGEIFKVYIGELEIPNG